MARVGPYNEREVLDTQKKAAINLSVAALPIVVGMLLPWARVNFEGTIPASDGQPAFVVLGPPLGDFTALQGSLTIAGLHLPNYLVLMLALNVVVVAWLHAFQTLRAPKALLVALSLYLPLHLVMSLMVILVGDAPDLHATIGEGLVITLFGTVLFAWAALAFPHTAKPDTREPVSEPA
jgi:hypothetical protein